jgi:hypothetical protein
MGYVFADVTANPHAEYKASAGVLSGEFDRFLS